MTYATPRPGHLQVRPVAGKSLRPLFARPHYVRRVAANGRTDLLFEPGYRFGFLAVAVDAGTELFLHHSQGYATRRGAVRAARRAGDEAGMWVHVLDSDTPPRTIRTYPPRRQGGAR